MSGMFSTPGDIMSTVGGYNDVGEGHWETIEFVWKPQCTEHPPVYS